MKTVFLLFISLLIGSANATGFKSDFILERSLQSVVSTPAASQTRWVEKFGKDTNPCSYALPCLTIARAEATITDASSTKLYTVKVGPGQYDLVSSFTKKNFVFWGGAGRRLTAIRTGTSGTGITLSAAGDITVGFQAMQFQQGGGPFLTLNQTASGTGNVFLVDVKDLHNSSIVATGWETGSLQVETKNSEINGSVTLHGASSYALNSYIGGRTTADSAANLTPNTPVVLSCDTISGNAVITCASVAGVSAGAVASGSGIQNGSRSAQPSGLNITLDRTATATASGVSVSFVRPTNSSIGYYSSTFGGMTLTGYAVANTRGSHSQGTNILNNDGIQWNAGSEALRTSANNTIPSGNFLTRMSNAFGTGYTPADGSKWADPDPTNEQDALDRMAALLYTLNTNTAIP